MRPRIQRMECKMLRSDTRFHLHAEPPHASDIFSALGLIRAVVALLVAMGVSVVAAIVFGFIAGHLTLLTAAAALICGAGNAIYILKRVPLSAEPTRASVLDWFV